MGEMTAHDGTLLVAAQDGDELAFRDLMAPLRTQLHAHCYRMLGSAADADDALQEVLLRAWRGLHAFEGRSSLRSWLYRIATNVCLTLLDRRPKRVLPLDHGPPADRPRAGRRAAGRVRVDRAVPERGARGRPRDARGAL